MATLITQSIAAASATLQTDLLRNSVHRLNSKDRMITGAAVGGSAAAGDFAVEVYVSDVLVATLYGIGTGVPTGYELYPIGAPVPGGSEIRAIVIDAPSTNPIFLVVELEDTMAAY